MEGILSFGVKSRRGRSYQLLYTTEYVSFTPIRVNDLHSLLQPVSLVFLTLEQPLPVDDSQMEGYMSCHWSGSLQSPLAWFVPER